MQTSAIAGRGMGTAAPGITEVPRKTLQEIADRLTAATGIPADVYD